MKRKLTVLLTMLMVLAMVMGVTVACNRKPTGKPAGPEGGTYYCDDGSETYYISLKDDSKFTFEVAGENREGNYEFAGTSLTMKFSETETVSAQLREYNEMTFTYKNKNYTFLRDVDYTVNFESQGSAVDSLSVKNGRVAKEPNSPTKSGYFFAGWYEDAQYKTRFNFGSKITGNKTLYGKFVEAIAADPEYTVTFVTGAGATQIDPMQTKGGMIDAMSIKPTKSGAEFLGWWVSHENNPEKLTYKYELERLYEDTTFYAVWSDGTPAVSVKDGEATWTGTGEATVEVTNPDGSKATPTVSGNKATIAFNATGEYQVKVTVGGKSSTAYYTHNRISRVSVFKTVDNILQFYKVPEATSYKVELKYKNGEEESTATLSTIADDANQNILAVDFHTYDIPSDGYVFTVTASADNKVESKIDYTLNRVLDKVTGISVDDATQSLKWNAIADADGYIVTITENGKAPETREVKTAECSFADKDPGAINFEVAPVKKCWNSPETEKYDYNKVTLAMVTDIRLEGETLKWKADDKVDHYILTINGNAQNVTGAEFTLNEQEHIKDGKTEITIVAVPKDSKYKNSPVSAVFNITVGAMGDITYEKGKVKWDAVFGARDYVVKVNDGAEQKVDNALECEIKLTAKVNTIAVKVDDENSEWKEITVEAEEIKLERGYVGEPLPSLFKVKGDPMDLEKDIDSADLNNPGYSFSGWEYAEGEIYEDDTFAGGELTLTAKWTPNNYHITLDSSEHSNDSYSDKYEVTFDSEELTDGSTLPVPTTNNDEYAFEGWYGEDNVRMTDDMGKLIKPYRYVGDQKFTARFVLGFEFEALSDGNYRVKGRNEISSLTKIKIPYQHNNGYVTEVSDFTMARNLVTIEIPETVQYMNTEYTVVSFSGLTNIEYIDIYAVPEFRGDRIYSDIDGVLFINNLDNENKPETLLFYPFGRIKKDVTYDVPEGTKTIEEGAFYSKYTSTSFVLQTVNIPASVSFINESAFRYMSSLEYINFDDRGEEADDLTILPNTFFNCDSISKITLPKRMKNIDITVFESLKGLREIEVEHGSQNFSSDNNGLLYNPKGGESGNEKELLYYPLGKTETTFRIPEDVYRIGKGAFRGNTALESITITGQVKNIGESAFENCARLETITFLGDKDSADLRIEDYAFYCGSSLITSLTLPANLAYLGKGAFGNIPALREVTVNTSDREINFASGAFRAMKELSARSTVYNVKLGGDVPFFNVSDVFGDALKEVTLLATNDNFYFDDGVLYNKDLTQMVFFPPDWQGDYTLPDQMSAIPAGMFKGRSGLTEVVIKGNIKEIGNEAFSDCTHLVNVKFEGITELTIGQSAFSGCTGLGSIDLPEGLSSIGDNAFANCTSLHTIKIPASVETMERYTDTAKNATIKEAFRIFKGCTSLATIEVAEDSEYFTEQGGVLYSVRKTADGNYVPDMLLYCPVGIKGTVTVPSSVRSVAGYAFNNLTGVNTVVFEELKETQNAPKEDGSANADIVDLKLYAYAFSYDSVDMDGITSVTLPEGIKTIGKYGFDKVPLGSIEIPASVEKIEINAFNACANITKFTFRDGDKDLRIDDGSGVNQSAFYGLTNLTSIEFPARLTYLGKNTFKSTNLAKVTFKSTAENNDLTIGDYAFQFTKLTSITLPANLATLGQSSLYGCDLLSEVNFASGIRIKTIGGNTFYNCPSLTSITIPKSVTTMRGFNNCVNLTTVNFEEGSQLKTLEQSAFEGSTSLAHFNYNGNLLETIGTRAFRNTSLTSFVIPNTVKTIGQYAFSTIKTLNSITFAPNSSLTSVDINAFENTPITSFEFPESTSDIALKQLIFRGCKNLENVTISKSVKTIDVRCFFGSVIDNVTVKDNPYFEVKDGAIYSKDTNNFVCRFREDANNVYEIPEGTAAIADRLFENQTGLTHIRIPATVKTIGQYAFAGCVNLETVEFATGSLLEKVDVYAFYGCTSLKSISFANTDDLTTIGNYAFQYCRSLTSVDFGTNKITTFGSYVFQSCGLTKVDLSNTQITQTGSTMFQHNKHLETVILPTTLTTLNTSTFNGCVSLSYVGTSSDNIVPHTVDLSACTQLSKITSYAFRDCANIQKVDMSGTAVTEASSYVFAGCTSLTDITFSTALKNIATFAFQNCTSLQKVNLPANGVTIKNNAFQGCIALNEVNLDAVTELGNNCFDNSGFTSIVIPASVQKYGTSIFANCASLSSVTFDAGVSTLPDSMFMNCEALTKVDLINSRISKIGASAFSGCIGLTDIKLNNRIITEIGNYAFDGCTNLGSVVFPSTLKHIGQYTFRNCVSLEEIDLTITNVTKFTDGMDVDELKDVTETTDSYVFDGCTSLSSVLLPDDFTQIGGYAFRNCTSLETLDIPAVTTIGRFAFYGSGIKKVTLSKVTDLMISNGHSPFDGSAIDTVEIDGNENFKLVQNYNGTQFTALESSDEKTVYYLFLEKEVAAKELDLSAYGDKMNDLFGKMGGIYTKITLPAITDIPAYAFYNVNAEEIILPEGLKTIGDYAFFGSAIKKVTIPASVSSIGKAAFAYCASLTDVTFAESANGAETLVWADGVNATTTDNPVNAGVFEYSAIERINIPARLSVIAKAAFRATTGVLELTIPETITNIDNFAFVRSGITNIHLPETGLTNIGASCFYESKLESIVVPASVTTVGANAFYKCTELVSAEIRGATLSGSNTFAYDTKLKTVILGEGITSIGETIFVECTALQSVKLPESLTTIGNSAFANCTALTRLELPKNLETIDTGAFGFWGKDQTIVFKLDEYTALNTLLNSSAVGIDWFSLATLVFEPEKE